MDKNEKDSAEEEVEEDEEAGGEERHGRWRGSISGRGCYGANNRRLKRKNKGLAVHHRGFRPGQGYPREEERARGTEGGGGAGREGSDSHTLAHAYTRAYVHSMHHVSAGYPRRQGHYRIITYHTYCATTMMARACEHHRQTSPPPSSLEDTRTRVRASPYIYERFYSHVELRLLGR